MSKFFVSPDAISENKITIDNKEDLHHLKKVLRAKVSDEVDISDSFEWEYSCIIESIEEDRAVLKICDKQKFAREPKLKVSLYQGIPKTGKMEVVIQKCVEEGVYTVTPVFMSRTVVVDKGKFDKKIQRWQKVSSEAVKQCKRGIIPEVKPALKFDQMIDELKNYDVVLFPYENEENITIKDELRKLAQSKESPKSIAIIIGPEGGFSDEEASALATSGAKSVSLGKTILRSETAGLVALAMTMYELEL